MKIFSLSVFILSQTGNKRLKPVVIHLILGSSYKGRILFLVCCFAADGCRAPSEPCPGGAAGTAGALRGGIELMWLFYMA